jgi:hypothetical protein
MELDHSEIAAKGRANRGRCGGGEPRIGIARLMGAGPAADHASPCHCKSQSMTTATFAGTVEFVVIGPASPTPPRFRICASHVRIIVLLLTSVQRIWHQI